MSGVMGLLKNKDVKSLRGKLISSVGVGNLAKSVVRSMVKRNANSSLGRHLIIELWNSFGDRRAVVTDNGTLTFRQLAESAVHLASAFYKHGIRQQDRVAILLHNEQAWFQVMAACMVSGIKMPMLNTHLKEQELIECINSTKAKVLVFSDTFLNVIERNRQQLQSIELFVCATQNSEEAFYTRLSTLEAEGDSELPQGGFGFAQMTFSGGSTGTPKFITQMDAREPNQRLKGLSKQEMKGLKLKFAEGFCRLGMGSVNGQIVSLIPGPLYHAGVQIAVLPLYFGSTVVPMYKFDPEKFLATVEKERVNWTFVAPTMLERILKLPDEVKSRYDLSSMQIIMCAAAPCPDHIKRDINKLFKQQGARCSVFNEYYGSSEAVLISVLRAEDYEAKDKRYASVGYTAASDCRIYNFDEARWCKPNEEGHVLIRNPRVFQTQYGNNAEIESAFKEINGQYWYDDGCVGYLDEDSFLYLTSRSKDMIISGGVNIYPVEIENVLKSHNAIVDAAVVKVTDADLGEVPGAVIQPVKGSDLSEEDILGHCKANGLYGFKLPRYIRLLDELPRKSSGKLRKSELEHLFADITESSEKVSA